MDPTGQNRTQLTNTPERRRLSLVLGGRRADRLQPLGGRGRRLRADLGHEPGRQRPDPAHQRAARRGEPHVLARRHADRLHAQQPDLDHERRRDRPDPAHLSRPQQRSRTRPGVLTGRPEDRLLALQRDGRLSRHLGDERGRQRADRADDALGELRRTFNPDYAPDGQRLVFDRFDQSQDDVFVVNADGTGEAPLTSGAADLDLLPVFSPDGTRIAFERDNAAFTVANVVLADPSGLNQGITPLAANSPPVQDFEPGWQPLNPPSCRPRRQAGAEVGQGGQDHGQVRERERDRHRPRLRARRRSPSAARVRRRRRSSRSAR